MNVKPSAEWPGVFYIAPQAQCQNITVDLVIVAGSLDNYE